jgi:hypothetical protein
MMPHPERCSEDVLGGHDGRLIFESMMEAFGKEADSNGGERDGQGL